MSYILDALKKAERERNVGAVPNLASWHGPETARRIPRFSSTWGVGFVALLCAGVALLWMSAKGPRDPQNKELAPMDSTEPIDTLSRESSRRVEPEPLPPTNGAMTSLPKQEAADRPSVTQPLASLVKTEVSVQAAPMERSPVDTSPTADAQPVREMKQSPPAQPVPSASQVDSTPWLHELPAHERSSIPPLQIDSHVYSNSIPSRFVILNGRVYRQGATLQNGVRLVAILPEGILASFRGISFRIGY